MTSIVVENAAVVTMDPDLGDFPRADVLVVDGAIAEVRPGIDVDEAL